MTPDRWTAIEDLFGRASDLSVAEREGFLVGACGDDRELRIEVESLLASSVDAREALDDVIAGVAVGVDADRLRAGSVIADRFELEAAAGHGGMGRVFRGRDRRTSAAVAIKVLTRSRDEAERLRFAREAQILGELDHPAIVRLVATGETPGGEPYLVMAWVAGASLDARLARGPIAVADVVSLARTLAGALSAVHAKGVIHRDVKPANVILEHDDLQRPRLVDFGVARVQSTISMTRTGHLLGTPSYMAPEQARGARDLDARADVFSLGCVLYECLTGRPAFTGPTTRTVLAKVLLEEPAPLADRVPRELAALVASMLAKDPARRPRDAVEVEARLASISIAAEPALDELPQVPGFEVVRRIGRGGSSDVFEAVRIGAGGFRKAVALKQLIADERLAGKARERFFEEARLSAQLEHPNLVRVADVITVGTRAFIVMDLLRGSSLADAAASLRDWRVVLSIGDQLLAGLAYAHGGEADRAPLVHRDLTPRNVFACTDGTVKILDFGIARAGDGVGLTTTGHIHGTLSFLSPEQARGERADRRSDLYQLGATLYWLLTAKLPHADAIAVGEIIARIASGRVVPLRDAIDVPDDVASVVERAMAPRPDDRFQSADEMRDAVTAILATVPAAERGPSAITRALNAGTETRPPTTDRKAASTRARRRPWWRWSIVGVAGVAFGAGLTIARCREVRPVAVALPAPALAAAVAPQWRQLTFDVGKLSNARFIPGRAAFLYSGHWETSRFSVREQTYQEGRTRQVVDDASLAAVSRDDVYVILQPQVQFHQHVGTLAKVPLAGGGPRELATGVFAADVSRDGSSLAVARYATGRMWIEWPLGHELAGPATIYDTVRLSPTGDRLAATEIERDDQGETYRVVVFDGSGARRVVGAPWLQIDRIVWSPAGDALWISGSRSSKIDEVIALDLEGHERRVLSSPESSELTDLDPTGRALVIAERLVDRVVGDPLGSGREHYLPTYYGRQTIVSPDLKWFLFMDDAHAMADGDIAVYRAPLDGSTPPVHFADGIPRFTTTDGRWLLVSSGRRDRLSLVPLAAGTAIEIPTADLRDITRAVTLHGDRSVIFNSRRGNEASRLYRVDLDGGSPRLAAPPGIRLPAEVQTVDLQSPDGRTLLVVEDAVSTYRLLSLSDGTIRPIPNFHPESNATWRTDSSLWVWVNLEGKRTELYEHDLATGKETLIRTFLPLDDTGGATSGLTWISRDLTRYIKWETQRQAFLYVVDGLR